jgi:catechol 2,3-dioxygenase-like lactoylglutathione lyase family enzyme
MPFHLDHTVVPARDKEASARFFARIFGLEYKGPWGPFAPVKVDEHLSMDFDERRQEFAPPALCVHHDGRRVRSGAGTRQTRRSRLR